MRQLFQHKQIINNSMFKSSMVSPKSKLDCIASNTNKSINHYTCRASWGLMFCNSFRCNWEPTLLIHFNPLIVFCEQTVPLIPVLRNTCPHFFCFFCVQCTGQFTLCSWTKQTTQVSSKWSSAEPTSTKITYKRADMQAKRGYAGLSLQISQKGIAKMCEFQWANILKLERLQTYSTWN